MSQKYLNGSIFRICPDLTGKTKLPRAANGPCSRQHNLETILELRAGPTCHSRGSYNTRGRQESSIRYPLPVATLDSCRFDMVSQRQRTVHYWTLLDTFLGFPRRRPYVTALPPMPHPQGTTHPWQQSQISWQGQLAVPKEERHPVLDTGRESRGPHLHSRVRRNGAVLR